MSQEEKMLFAEHLSLMLKGGVPLSEALESLRNDAESREFKKALSETLKRILEGESLSGAMAHHPKVFDRFYRDIVRVGEESGTLEENLNYLSVKLRKDSEMQTKVKGAMLYPLLIVAMGLLIIALIVFFVLPKLIVLFKALTVELPLTTRILIYTVSFVQKYSLLVFLGILFLIILFKFLTKRKTVRFFLDRLSLSLPVIGKVFKNFNISFLSHTFYILLKSGVPLLNALEIISETVPNEVYAKSVLKIKEKVEGGEKISQSLKYFPDLFPAVFGGMISIGEKSGNLEESLLYLSEHYERGVDSTLKNLSTVLEPILLVLVGFLVLFIALAIITPIYKLLGEMQLR